MKIIILAVLLTIILLFIPFYVFVLSKCFFIGKLKAYQDSLKKEIGGNKDEKED